MSRAWCRYAAGLACGLVAVLTAACSSGPAASVGDVDIPRATVGTELDAILSNARYLKTYERASRLKPVDGDGRPTKLFTAVTLTNRITSVGIAEVAERRHIRITSRDRQTGRSDAAAAVGGEDVLRAFPAWYRSELVQRVTTAVALRRSFIDETTPRQFYERHKKEFVRACTSDLIVRTKPEAAAARRRILAGESFASVARDVSLDQGTAPRGGFLSCNERRDLVLELDDAAFTLPIGEVSQPIEIENGVHLFLVTSRKTPPLSKIGGQIEGAIEESARQQAGSLMRQTLKEIGVEVAPDYGRWDEAKTRIVPS